MSVYTNTLYVNQRRLEHIIGEIKRNEVISKYCTEQEIIEKIAYTLSNGYTPIQMEWDTSKFDAEWDVYLKHIDRIVKTIEGCEKLCHILETNE